MDWNAPVLGVYCSECKTLSIRTPFESRRPHVAVGESVEFRPVGPYRIDNAPIRETGGDPRRVSDDAPEVAIARDLHVLSKAVVKDHLGEEFTLNRGIGFGLPVLATEMLDRPEQTEYSLNPTVLSNLTFDERTATGYSGIVTRIQTTPNDIALAPDSLIRHRSEGDGELVSDGEMQIRAETVRTVDREAIMISRTERTIADVFEKIPTREEIDAHAARLQREPNTEPILSQSSHQAVAEIVREMGDASQNPRREYEGVETSQASQTLSSSPPKISRKKTNARAQS